jgi:hypothetical protein
MTEKHPNSINQAKRLGIVSAERDSFEEIKLYKKFRDTAEALADTLRKINEVAHNARIEQLVAQALANARMWNNKADQAAHSEMQQDEHNAPLVTCSSKMSYIRSTFLQ